MGLFQSFWDNLDLLRKINNLLQWIPIVLIFLGGCLQLAKIYIDRREKYLISLAEPITRGNASVELRLSGAIPGKSWLHRNDEDKIFFKSDRRTVLSMSSTQVRVVPDEEGRVLVEGHFKIQPSDASIGLPRSILAEVHEVTLQIRFVKHLLMKLPHKERKILTGKFTSTINDSILPEIELKAIPVDKHLNINLEFSPFNQSR